VSQELPTMAPTHKTPFALVLAELAISITAVTLFSLMYPVGFRSRLWENGGEQGWNSNPNKRIYYYANHQEPPEVPLIWSQRYDIPRLDTLRHFDRKRTDVKRL
jgi:hypothetical protein